MGFVSVSGKQISKPFLVRKMMRMMTANRKRERTRDEDNQTNRHVYTDKTHGRHKKMKFNENKPCIFQ